MKEEIVKIYSSILLILCINVWARGKDDVGYTSPEKEYTAYTKIMDKSLFEEQDFQNLSITEFCRLISRRLQVSVTLSGFTENLFINSHFKGGSADDLFKLLTKKYEFKVIFQSNGIQIKSKPSGVK
jgi:hypothetical protein